MFSVQSSESRVCNHLIICCTLAFSGHRDLVNVRYDFDTVVADIAERETFTWTEYLRGSGVPNRARVIYVNRCELRISFRTFLD